MEYEEDNGAAGSIPDFGAIFMSSIVTKKDCFKHNLFALPLSMAEFVKQVKAGMVLFLFEFEKRQLYGVFQASSDGTMDIAPHLFNYPGKRFPAQVPFTQIWRCNPLPEKVFRDAIKENYFSPKKFNFGLSEDQVRRLLYLFSSRKLEINLSSFQLPQVVDGKDSKDGGQACNDTVPLCIGQYIDSTEHHGFKPTVLLHDHQMNSLDRGNEDELLIEAGDAGEGKIYPLGQGDFLAKRRRVDKDDKSFRNDVADSEIYSNEIIHCFPLDSREDSSDEVDRLDSARRLSRIEQVLKENQVDKFHYPVMHSDYPMSSLDGRAINVGQFMQRNKLLSENNIAHGSELVFAGECYRNPLDQTKHQGKRFLFDECIQREQDARNIVKPTDFGDDKVYPCWQSREVIDDQHRSMTRILGNRDYMDYSDSHVSYFKRSASVLHKVKNAKVGDDTPAHCRIHTEPVFISSSMENIPSDNSASRMNSGQRLIHHGRYPNVGGRVAVNTMDGILFSAGTARHAGQYRSVEGRVVDDGRYRMSQRPSDKEDKEDIDTLTSPIVSKEYPSFYEQKESISSCFDGLPEKMLSQLNEDNKSEPSSSRFKDATVTRVVPYVPEYPSFSHGYSASMAANNGKSGLMQEKPHYQHSFQRHSYSSKIRLSPYSLGSDMSTRAMDTSPECADEALLSDTSGQQGSYPRYTPSFLNSNLPRQTALGTVAPVDHRGSMVSKLSSHDQRNIGRDEGYSTHPFTPSKNHFAFDANLATTSRLGKCVPQQERNMLIGNKHSQQQEKDTLIGNNIGNDIGICVYDQVRGLTGNQNQFSEMSCNRNDKGHHVSSEAPHFNSSGNRRSVFTRLSSRQESRVVEERSEIKSDSNDCFMNASADEIMEMLQQGNDMKNMNYRLVGKPKHGESAVGRKQIQIHNEVSQSKKEKIDETKLAMEESVDLPKETRIVNFKRRSVAKRSVVHTSNDSTAGLNKAVGLTCNDSTADHKANDLDKAVEIPTTITLKRRRLIRPVFGKVETATTISSHDDKQGRDIGKAINSNEVKMPDAICSNESSLLLVLNKNDEQNCNREKGTGSSETELRNAVCSNENSQVVVLHKEDKQNCEKVVGSSKAQMRNVVCSNQDLQLLGLHKEDEQNCKKAISSSEAEMSDACCNEDSQFLGHCEKATCSSEVEMPDAVFTNEDPQLLVLYKGDKCIKENSQLLVIHEDDKQNTDDKVIKHNVTVVPDYDASFGCAVASDPHHLLK